MSRVMSGRAGWVKEPGRNENSKPRKLALLRRLTSKTSLETSMRNPVGFRCDVKGYSRNCREWRPLYCGRCGGELQIAAHRRSGLNEFYFDNAFKEETGRRFFETNKSLTDSRFGSQHVISENLTFFWCRVGCAHQVRTKHAAVGTAHPTSLIHPLLRQHKPSEVHVLAEAPDETVGRRIHAR